MSIAALWISSSTLQMNDTADVLVINHFHHFYDSVHIDEKWFFISEEMLPVYCAPDEDCKEFGTFA